MEFSIKGYHVCVASHVFPFMFPFSHQMPFQEFYPCFLTIQKRSDILEANWCAFPPFGSYYQQGKTILYQEGHPWSLATSSLVFLGPEYSHIWQNSIASWIGRRQFYLYLALLMFRRSREFQVQLSESIRPFFVFVPILTHHKMRQVALAECWRHKDRNWFRSWGLELFLHSKLAISYCSLKVWREPLRGQWDP